MKKRKSTGKFLSRLLCLVTVMGMLVPMALADEWGRVPGSSFDCGFADLFISFFTRKKYRPESCFGGENTKT